MVYRPCRTADDSYFCTRVTLAQTIQIPPRQEIIVCGHVARPVVTSEWGLLEPYKEGVLQSKGIGVAHAVVPTGDTVHIRLLNAQDHTSTIKQGTAIASLTPLYPDNVCEALPVTTQTAPPEDISQQELPEHLVELFKRSVTELDDNEGIEIQRLL